MWGKHFSKETRKKLSDGQKGIARPNAGKKEIIFGNITER
jgi:hypothetical protein